MHRMELIAQSVFEGTRKPGYQRDLDCVADFQNTKKGRSIWAKWCRDPKVGITPRNVIWVWQENPFSWLGLYLRKNGPGEYFDLTTEKGRRDLKRKEMQVAQVLKGSK